MPSAVRTVSLNGQNPVLTSLAFSNAAASHTSSQTQPSHIKRLRGDKSSAGQVQSCHEAGEEKTNSTPTEPI
jgi:hypothetical protein